MNQHNMRHLLLCLLSGTKLPQLKKEEADDCTGDSESAACYDHTGNLGIGPVKVGENCLTLQHDPD